MVTRFQNILWAWAFALFGLGVRVNMALVRKGYDHPNEVYRFMEPLWKILFGRFAPAMEYNEKMLSFFSNYLHVPLAWILVKMGVDDGLTIMTVYRLFYALLAALGFYNLWSILKNLTNIFWANMGLLFMALWWPLAYWQIHLFDTSLETAIILFSLDLYLRPGSDKRFSINFLIGLLLASAFFVRYQSILFSAVFFLYACWKGEYKRILPSCLGFIIVLPFAFLGDFYQGISWPLAPWIYFKYNIIEGKAAGNFGKDPFYRYFFDLMKFYSPPFFLFLCYFFVRGFRHSLLIGPMVLFHLLIHTFIDHKEFRFLFTLLPLIPLVAILGLARFEWNKRRIKFCFAILILSWSLSLYQAVSKYQYSNFLDPCLELKQVSDELRSPHIIKESLEADASTKLYILSDLTFACGSFSMGTAPIKAIPMLESIEYISSEFQLPTDKSFLLLTSTLNLSESFKYKKLKRIRSRFLLLVRSKTL